MARVCVFDANETLLDMGAPDPSFKRIFGDSSVRQTWFNQFLVSWLAATKPTLARIRLYRQQRPGDGRRATGRRALQRG